MTLPSWDDADRLTEVAWSDLDHVRLSDYTQLLDALKALAAWLAVDHDPDTGRHLTTPLPDAWEDAASTPLNFTYSADPTMPLAYTISDPTWSSPNALHHSSGLFAVCLSGTDLFEIVCYISMNEHMDCPVFGLRRLTGTSSTRVRGRTYFLPVYGPEWVRDSDVLVLEKATAVQFRSHTDRIGYASGAVRKSLYRQCWRLAKTLQDSMIVEHDQNTMASIAPSPQRLAGRQLGSTSVDVFDDMLDLSQSHQYEMAPHGGEFCFVFPWMMYWYQNDFIGFTVAPAFDDALVYLDVQGGANPWKLNGGGWVSHELIPRAAVVTDSSDDEADLPVLDTSTLAQQGYSIQPDEWEQIRSGLERLKRLFAVEHDFATGGHRFSLASIPGMTKVFEGPVTAPTAIADVALTQDSSEYYRVWDPSTATDITTTLIDDEVSSDTFAMYLPSLVGEPGSGIVTATIAMSNSEAHLVLRRKTAGTTNAFTARVWRLTFPHLIESTGMSGGYVTCTGSPASAWYKPDTSPFAYLYEGSEWILHTIPSAGISVTVASADGSPTATDTDYFLYLYDSAGTLKLEHTATAPTTQDGIPVKTGDASHLLVAWTHSSAVAGQGVLANSHERGWCNVYNRRLTTLRLELIEAESWDYASTAWRKANNGPALWSPVRAMCGGLESVTITASQACGSSETAGMVGIGVDDTTPVGMPVTIPCASGIWASGSATARATIKPAQGMHAFYVLERCAGAGTVTFSAETDPSGSGVEIGTSMIVTGRW